MEQPKLSDEELHQILEKLTEAMKVINVILHNHQAALKEIAAKLRVEVDLG